MARNTLNRRAFVKVAAGTLAAIPFISRAEAAPEKLSEEDSMAVALGYKAVSTDVDAAKYASHKDDQLCKGCALWQGADAEWGGCSIFPGKLVSANGWCAAYAAKPA
ncbi:high-potential iron-sulfur protein [Arenicella xantha]|uniref:High-potential iron-sulfur protein n=1 Tax=Arenicella xantha TaxID=644221 RepID=A0A395JLI3_9GAMM|nr:high-potential iron-sulfur protein [Arenicella xantha]RBP51656.1 high potential iron-sulfur protein [Arenicella xantha]